MKTIQLQYPIEAHGKQVTELTLQRPKGKDLRAVDGMKEVEQTLTLISRLGNIPPSSVADMDVVDIMACGEVIAGFLSPSRAAGSET